MTTIVLAFVLTTLAPPLDLEQATSEAAPSRAQIIDAARQMMTRTRYCALVTVGGDGHPQAREVDAFAPDAGMTVWIATSTLTHKAQQMRHDSRVTLYYADHSKAAGYVAIMGRAQLVDDRAEMVKRKRAYWNQAFPEFKNLVLIKVVPETMHVLNYSRGALGDTTNWHPPTVEFKKN